MAGLWQRLLDTLRTNKTAKKRVATHNRRSLRVEFLERRQTMDASITGVVFNDLTENGLDGSDPLLASVPISLFRDGGNGTFDNGTGDDIAAGTTTSAAVTGLYTFPVTSTGLHFVVQTAASGSLVQRATQRVQSVNVTTVADAASINIDDFDSPATNFSADFTGTNPGSDTTTGLTNVQGGVRDLHANATAGILTVSVDGGNSNALDLQPSLTGDGVFTVTYDGDGTNGASALGNALGAGTNDFDLTQAGTATSFRLLIGTEAANATILVRVTGTGGTSATAAIPIPITTNGASATLDIPFTSLSGTANLTQIGAIQFEVNQDQGQDTQIANLGLFGPTVFTQNIANLSPMSIGNLVFLDRNNDGLFAGADTGIGGVDLQLFNDLGVVGTFEPGTDTAVTVGSATATTSSSVGTLGQYSFTGLLPGNYFVVIPAAEFATGQPLANHVGSPGQVTADTNNADHGGAFVAGVGITSAVVLAAGAEPINDDDTDANTNTTVDFGLMNAVLTLTKTDTPDPVNTGSNLTYTLTATNTGPSNSTNTVITDALPTGLTFVSGTFSVNGGAAQNAINTAGTITTAPFTLTSGQSTVLTIIATVGAGFVTGTSNTGSVDSDEAVAVTANATTAVTPNIDLGVTKAIVGGATTVGVGGTLTYRLTLTNNSTTTTVTGIEVNDDLPAGFTPGTLPSGVATGTAPADLVWSIASLAPSASVTVDIPVNVGTGTAIGVATNTATIDLPGLVGFNDTVSNNNTATVPVTVEPRYDLLITKDDTVTSVTTGQTVTYTLSINNSGPSPATNVQVTDTLPAGLEFISATSGGNPIGSATGQAYSATIASLASNATTTISLVVRVRPGATGASIVNTASVTAANPTQETAGRSNTATDTDTLNRTVTLNITKTDSTDPVIAGGANFTYTVTAFNSGSADAPNVLFSDPLPTGITFVSGTFTVNETIPRNGTVTFNSTTNRLEADLGTLLAGGSATVNRALITLTVQAAATAAAGTVTNTATLTSPDNTAGVSDGEDTTISRNFDVTVSKTRNTSNNVSSGESLVYTIIVSNTGVSTATNVGLSDPIPANLTFVSVTSSAGTFSNQSGTITGTIPTLVQGTPVTVTVTTTVNNNTPDNTTISNTATVTAAGESNTNNNTATVVATVANTATLRGFVYIDSNRNSTRDTSPTAEPGIAGVTVGISGTINGSPVNRTATTDANGEYVFTGLTPGVYTVQQTQPSNFTSVATNPGSTGGTAGTDQISTINLTGGANSINNNFGENRVFSKRRFLASSNDN
jgi:uncharacterized repeat protein (TIGR01451 family)